jgi:hypothetical protein
MGTVPDVSGALQDRFQQMTFTPVTKNESGYQVVETPNPTAFIGHIQPFTERQLMMKPEGQRAWTWWWIQSITPIALNVDDVINWQGTQLRIMSVRNNFLYGFYEWSAIEDWTGAGP